MKKDNRPEAAYCRVSDDKLKTNGQRRQDVRRQVDLLQKRAGKKLQLFIDDGISAFKEDYHSRPEFVRLLREVKSNHIKRVWVENLSRWARRVVDGLQTLQMASDHHCTVTSIAEGEIDVTIDQDWMKSTFALMMAEYASREKAGSVRDGMERARNKKENICPTCKVVHLGRHPLACGCENCTRKKGRSKRA